MKRNFIITDEIKKWIKDKNPINKDEIRVDLQSHLSENTQIRITLIDYISKCRKDLRRFKPVYDKVYRDVYSSFTKKNRNPGYRMAGMLPENEKERELWTEADPQVRKLKRIISEIEHDIDELKKYEFAFQGKGFEMGHMKDIEIWKSGGK